MENHIQIVKDHIGKGELLGPGQIHSSSLHKTSDYQTVPRHPGNKDTVLSCRYELKYRIRESKARAIAEYIHSYLPIDHYARNAPNHEYPICSLYFDSDQLHLCKETMERKVNRFKLRVRCYDENLESFCYAEIKRRLNTIIIKDRSRLSKQILEKVIQNLYVPDSMYEKNRKNLRQFQYYLRALCARPVILVRYLRQAFEGDSHNRVRITFDRQLSFKTTDRPVLFMNGDGWRFVPMDFVILEIKFTDRYPLWLSDMVKVFDLKQVAMSKYVSSVQQSCSMGFCGPMCTIGV